MSGSKWPDWDLVRAKMPSQSTGANKSGTPSPTATMPTDVTDKNGSRYFFSIHSTLSMR